MPVLELMPHYLQVLNCRCGKEDGNGDFVPAEESWGAIVSCDAVPSGKADEKVFEDGVSRKYSYTVYLPAYCRDLKVGERVRLFLPPSPCPSEFTVKGFHRWQHQCKAWL